MGLRKIVGIVLIILGVLGLVYQGIPYAQEEQVAEFGPVQIETEQQKSVPLHPVIGGILLVGGVVLILTDRKGNQ